MKKIIFCGLLALSFMYGADNKLDTRMADDGSRPAKVIIREGTGGFRLCGGSQASTCSVDVSVNYEIFTQRISEALNYLLEAWQRVRVSYGNNAEQHKPIYQDIVAKNSLVDLETEHHMSKADYVKKYRELVALEAEIELLDLEATFLTTEAILLKK